MNGAGGKGVFKTCSFFHLNEKCLIEEEWKKEVT